MLEDALLAEQAVAAECQAVIRGEDDDGVVRLAGLFECGENAADLFIEVCDQSIVLGELVTNHPLGARPCAEVFVTSPVHHAVIERELGEDNWAGAAEDSCRSVRGIPGAAGEDHAEP